jgi:hypothetical protein
MIKYLHKAQQPISGKPPILHVYPFRVPLKELSNESLRIHQKSLPLKAKIINKKEKAYCLYKLLL